MPFSRTNPLHVGLEVHRLVRLHAQDELVNILPRQARAKHRENLIFNPMFRSAGGPSDDSFGGAGKPETLAVLDKWWK